MTRRESDDIRKAMSTWLVHDLLVIASEAIDQWQPAPYRTTVQAVISRARRLRTGLYGLVYKHKLLELDNHREGPNKDHSGLLYCLWLLRSDQAKHCHVRVSCALFISRTGLSRQCKSFRALIDEIYNSQPAFWGRAKWKLAKNYK